MLDTQENDQKDAQISALKRQNEENYAEIQWQKEELKRRIETMDVDFLALNVKMQNILKMSIVLKSCLTCCNIPSVFLFGYYYWIAGR